MGGVPENEYDVILRITGDPVLSAAVQRALILWRLQRMAVELFEAELTADVPK
jgi:hypothetical protein